jgi:hypothetical protein
LERLPTPQGKENVMAPTNRPRAPKAVAPPSPRTRIADIAAIGRELSPEHLRLVVGGVGNYETQYVTYFSGNSIDTRHDVEA